MTKLLKKDERTDGVTLDFPNLTIINKNRFLILFSHLGFILCLSTVPASGLFHRDIERLE